MSTVNAGIGRILAGCGGVLLIASLFLPWADGPGDISRNGWALLRTLDVLLLIVGLHAIVAALTGGRFGYFRPDLSLNAATDILGVAAAVLLGWLLAFDFPSGASPQLGAFVALIGDIAVACGAGDFRVRTFFPRIPGGERRAP
ncbi:MAG: hypothetical protein ACRDLL_06400 [Solirubrobacterales bacterium]